MDQPCVSFNLTQAAGGAAIRRNWHRPGQTVKILAISLDPNATSATNATNYVDLAFYVGSTQIGSTRTTSGSSPLTQGTAESISLSSVARSNLEVTSTSQFSARATQAASGVALDVQVHVVYEAM